MLAYFRWYRYAQPPANWLASLRLAGLLFMNRFLLFTLILVLGFASNVKAQDFTRGDLDFFFERVTFNNGEWEFKLSRNVHAMLWRIQTKHSDITGACEPGQILKVPVLASEQATLKIKGKGLELNFLPARPQGFNIYLRLEPEKGVSTETEERTAILIPHTDGSGRITIAYARD